MSGTEWDGTSQDGELGVGQEPESASGQPAPERQRTAMAPLLKLITGKVDVTIWIDRQQNVRKLREAQREGAKRMTVVCTYTGLNRRVHITVPPPSHVLALPTSALASIR